MAVAGGELLIPTIVLLYGVDIKIAGSLHSLSSCPPCLLRLHATAETKPSAFSAAMAGYWLQ
jgi:hypothetical protein